MISNVAHTTVFRPLCAGLLAACWLPSAAWAQRGAIETAVFNETSYPSVTSGIDRSVRQLAAWEDRQGRLQPIPDRSILAGYENGPAAFRSDELTRRPHEDGLRIDTVESDISEELPPPRDFARGEPAPTPRRLWLPRIPFPDFIHGDPDDPSKHIGKGNPLVGTSWLNRPYHFDLFAGGLFGDKSVDGRINQGNDFFSGFRLGWDFDHFWGGELRAAFATLDTFDIQNPSITGESKNEFLDAHLLYYPWGDAAMRPYFSMGMGIARFNFVDAQGRRLSEGLYNLPIGFGFKHYFFNWITLRFDFTDNIVFGSSRVAGMHNLSISAGTEIRFGARRRSYYPYHP